MLLLLSQLLALALVVYLVVDVRQAWQRAAFCPPWESPNLVRLREFVLPTSPTFLERLEAGDVDSAYMQLREFRERFAEFVSAAQGEITTRFGEPASIPSHEHLDRAQQAAEEFATEAHAALAIFRTERSAGVLVVSAALNRNWTSCRSGLSRRGAQRPRPWQNRDVINNVLRSIKRHAVRANLELTAPITVHTFRKSFGQNHAENGTPMHVLQQLMGHSNIATTRTFYIRVGDASELDAVVRYERLLSAPAGVPRQKKPITTDAGMTSEPVGR